MQVIFGLNSVDVFSCLLPFLSSGILALLTKPYSSSKMIRLLHTHPGGPGGPGGPVGP